VSFGKREYKEQAGKEASGGESVGVGGVHFIRASFDEARKSGSQVPKGGRREPRADRLMTGVLREVGLVPGVKERDKVSSE